MRVGLVQLCSGDMPRDNLPETARFIRDAAGQGAKFVLTPEVTNVVSYSRAHQNTVLQFESDDQTLRSLRELAAELKIWLLIGSLGLKTGDADGRFANRSFMIAPDGSIAARYDKIHMFDVDISETESFRESEGYRPGDRLSLIKTPFGGVGLTICYDLRFPQVYRELAQGGAQMITVPAAFSPVSGAAHWHVLLRARAIETGCFILAPAQCGSHKTGAGRSRETFGHSLVVAPWGEILADGGTQPGVSVVNIDLTDIEKARARIPSLSHDRPYKGWHDVNQ